MSGCYFDWRQGGGCSQTDAVNSNIIPNFVHFSVVDLFHTQKNTISRQREFSGKKKYES